MTGRRVLTGLIGLILASFLAAAFLYASRFWTWRFWSNDGLFGWMFLGRDGDILRRNLRDVAQSAGYGEINAFDVVIWGLLIFLILSVLQWLWNLLAPSHDP